MSPFFLHITSGRIQFTFGRRHGHGVNICILLYLLVFPFILQKSAGKREHGFGFFFYIYYTSSFFPFVTFLQFFPYLMPFFGVWGEWIGWGHGHWDGVSHFFLSFFCLFHGVGGILRKCIPWVGAGSTSGQV